MANPVSTSKWKDLSVSTPDIETAVQKPVLPSPLHDVIPKVWVVGGNDKKVMWLDMVFRSPTDLDYFETASAVELSRAATFFQLPSSKPSTKTACLRISSKFNQWESMFAVIFEHFPSLFPILSVKLSKQ